MRRLLVDEHGGDTVDSGGGCLIVYADSVAQDRVVRYLDGLRAAGDELDAP